MFEHTPFTHLYRHSHTVQDYPCVRQQCVCVCVCPGYGILLERVSPGECIEPLLYNLLLQGMGNLRSSFYRHLHIEFKFSLQLMK